MKPISNNKGISPIIATLLLILIAIAAGVIVYAYVVGFIGSSTSNTGGSSAAISIDQLSLTSKTTTFPVVSYLRNLGPASESFNTGFYVKSSTLNDQLAPAISLTASAATVLLTYTLKETAISQVTVTITCTGTSTVSVSMFGINGAATIACPAGGSTTITDNSLTFTNSPSNGNIADFTPGASFPLTTSPTYLAVTFAPGASINVAINQVGQFTLTVVTANASTSATVLSLSAGTTYSFQVTGTDGGTAVASAKSS